MVVHMYRLGALSLLFSLFLAAGCAQTDCEAMCDSQSTCTQSGSGIELNEDALAGCADRCEKEIKDKAVETSIVRCMADAAGDCQAITDCRP